MDRSAGQLPGEAYLYDGSESTESEVKRHSCEGDFLFIFVKSGIFRAIVDGKKIYCTSNELVIALCRHYCEVIKYSKKTSCYLVKVQWQFITDIKMSGQFIELLVNKESVRLFPKNFDSRVLLRIMKLLYYYQALKDTLRFPFSSYKAALSLLIYQAAWQQDSTSGTVKITYSRKELLTLQFLKMLVQHYREERSITFYARLLFVTQGYLTKSVREVTGKTVLECIYEVLLSEAKYLLMSTDATIELISEQLHFNSAGSFSRFFKKETNLTPTEYRRDYGR
ncbi:MAG: hypothetical protein DI539_17915 [Flavobacterium psychrophilum]|nr:MAG: hypothetical protein DI539_17915 [Flavobacterium psychrophilum]